MGPITQHLHNVVPELAALNIADARDWTFKRSLQQLGPDFYNKVLPLHPIVHLEYSLLCCELRKDFLHPEQKNRKQLVDRLVSALILCELLEDVHQNYLVVPREVVRLRKQKKVFRTLLSALEGYSFDLSQTGQEPEEEENSDSLSKQIRELTGQSNWYRILTTRSRRFVDLLHKAKTDSLALNYLARDLEHYMDPILAYALIFFYLPRLLTNTVLTLKNTLPGFGPSKKADSLNLTTRLFCQLQRRWFELGNDLIWTMVSVANVFILTGPLAGGAVYLATAAFAFDVIYALTRAYIELRRLYDLKKEYQDMLNAEQSRNQYDAIKNHLKFIDERIEFEHVRFGLHVSGTVLTLAAMSLAIPALGISPLLLVTSAAFLLVLWGVMFHLTRTLEHYRPNETLELASSVSKLGFFSSKKSASSKTPSADLDTSLALDAEAKCFETTSCISTI